MFSSFLLDIGMISLSSTLFLCPMASAILLFVRVPRHLSQVGHLSFRVLPTVMTLLLCSSVDVALHIVSLTRNGTWSVSRLLQFPPRCTLTSLFSGSASLIRWFLCLIIMWCLFLATTSVPMTPPMPLIVLLLTEMTSLLLRNLSPWFVLPKAHF